MCYTLHLASDKKLPIIDYSDANPGFYTSLRGFPGWLKSKFSHENILFLGSHEGCGCGFIAIEQDELKKAQRKRCIEDLRQYLKKALEQGAAIELYLYWDGDAEPKKKVIKLSDFDGEEFPLEEEELAEVLP